MRIEAGPWRSAGAVLSVLLLYAFLNPLAAELTPLPDLSGSEAAFVALAWPFAILGAGRLDAIDAVIPMIFIWSLVSAMANGVPTVSALLFAALLVCPFIAAKIIVSADPQSLIKLRRVLTFLVLAQVFMFVIQLATYSGVDDLKGTFVGTQYGEHVAALVVLIGASAYALSDNRGWRGPAALGTAVFLALLADSKIALVYYIGVGVVYVLIGRPLRKVRLDTRLLTRVAGAALGGIAMWVVYTGVLGTVALSSYVEQTAETGGGKPAIAAIILDPTSDFWQDENFLLGAGPAQTVSRAAGFTVPARLTPTPPGLRLGMEQARYYSAMQDEASGYGYIGRSSATSAASSVLGIVGDIGLVGATLYGLGYFWVYRQIASRSSWRSWPALAWLGLLVPGFLGEWLEFPPAMMFSAVALISLVIAVRTRSETTGVFVGKVDIRPQTALKKEKGREERTGDN